MRLSFDPVGFGAMHLSGDARPARPDAIAVVHAALDAGVRLIDTADAYCSVRRETGHNEVLVAEAVNAWRGPRRDVVVATKCGHVRDDAGGWHVDGRPEHLRAAAEASRARLGGRPIALLQLHRPDPAVPWADSIGAVAALLRTGVADHIGVSNVSVEQLDQASEIMPVASVQNELSPFEPASLPVLRWCHRHRVPFLAWAPLGGASRAADVGGETATAVFADVARSVSTDTAVSPHQVVLAWLVSLSPMVTVIPGARRVESVLDSVAAGRLVLDADHLEVLDETVRTLHPWFDREAVAS